MKKRAIVTGSQGQDGSYMVELLQTEGYEVTLLGKRELLKPTFSEVQQLLQTVQPHEIYNFAAQSSDLLSVSEPFLTAQTNAFLPLLIFEAVRTICPSCRVLQASSCLIFGKPEKQPQNERTLVSPETTSPYATSKAYAHQLASFYRQKYNLFIACSILYNHESPRRGIDFVTQKIAYAAACSKSGLASGGLQNAFGEAVFSDGKVKLGDLDAVRDWGYAPDYVKAMREMLKIDSAEDFVLATGKLHTIAEFCEIAFRSVNLDWRKYVAVDSNLVRPHESVPYRGDISKAKKILHWEPKAVFESWVKEMVQSHIDMIENAQQSVFLSG